ncbi:MAG: hypothetical protein V2A62_05350 [Candidatus Woesearchaeota archaeon]
MTYIPFKPSDDLTRKVLDVVSTTARAYVEETYSSGGFPLPRSSILGFVEFVLPFEKKEDALSDVERQIDECNRDFEKTRDRLGGSYESPVWTIIHRHIYDVPGTDPKILYIDNAHCFSPEILTRLQGRFHPEWIPLFAQEVYAWGEKNPYNQHDDPPVVFQMENDTLYINLEKAQEEKMNRVKEPTRPRARVISEIKAF